MKKPFQKKIKDILQVKYNARMTEITKIITVGQSKVILNKEFKIKRF